METPVIAKGLTVTFDGGVKALKKIDLELAPGKITGFIGPSGAGKTTLIRVLVGRQRISSGTVQILGHPAGSAKLRGMLSYMTQSLSVYPDLTVKENLTYFARMLGLRGTSVTSAVATVLEQVDLVPQATRMVGGLSGGQKQRVSLGVAMLGDPKMLILDEPTVGLDPVLRSQLWILFRQLTDQHKTVIVSSHVMDEASQCDDLVLIRDGVVLAHEEPEKLCKRTGSSTVEESFIKLVGKHA